MKSSSTSTMQDMDVLIIGSGLFSMSNKRRKYFGQLKQKSNIYLEWLTQTAKVLLCSIVVEKM